MKSSVPIITVDNAAHLTRVRQLGSPRVPFAGGQRLGFAPADNHLLATEESGVRLRWWKSLGVAEKTVSHGEVPLAEFKPGFLRDGSIVGIGAPVATAATPYRYRILALAVESGTLLHESALPCPVTCFGVRADGTALVLLDEGEAHLWNLETWQPMRNLRGISVSAQLKDCAFSPDGRYAAVVGTPHDGTSSGVWLWNLEDGTGPDHLSLSMPFAGSVAFHPSKPLLVVGGNSNEVDVVDVREFRITRTLKDFHCIPSNLDFSPEGDLLAAGGDGRGFAVHRFDTGERVFRHGDDNDLQTSDAVFSPDGRFIAWGQGDGTVGLWAVDPGS
ncbi:WD repeat-containing protein [Corallococcus coralloides DSM 2259]|uniref:WD repeat-containing protein n=1 Tax=Corallococcus coralloides (strain ATCC 25202 / DSM 2259 / NBRC 100086 / M2) TaxID=1144275 RepID=H8N095_CORCM